MNTKQINRTMKLKIERNKVKFPKMWAFLAGVHFVFAYIYINVRPKYFIASKMLDNYLNNSINSQTMLGPQVTLI